MASFAESGNAITSTDRLQTFLVKHAKVKVETVGRDTMTQTPRALYAPAMVVIRFMIPPKTDVLFYSFFLCLSVSDFSENLAQVYEQHAEALQLLVTSYRKRNGELRKER